MPIDSAAPAYHSSALKIARLTRFLSVRIGEAGSLTLPGFEFFVFDIAHPLVPLPQTPYRPGTSPRPCCGHRAAGKKPVVPARRIKTRKAFEYNAFASPARRPKGERALAATLASNLKL
jgi:hypothetical protein